MMIRPDTLAAIKAGDVDLAFRRWDRPRVVVGTRPVSYTHLTLPTN